jgi:Fic family protein
MNALVKVQEALKERVRKSTLRADTAHNLVDYAVAYTTFTVRQVEAHLSISYARANSLVSQLVGLGILAMLESPGTTNRRFYAPEVLNVLTSNN